MGRAATDEGTEEGSGTSDNPEPAPTPQPLQIEVATSPPTASYPCHPAGTIMVSGGGSSGDSDELTGSAEYPLEVTYQWFIRKVNPEGVTGAVVPIGPPGTLQFNHAGGIPVSGPELDPAPHIEMELRIVEPETISGGWIAHPDCA